MFVKECNSFDEDAGKETDGQGGGDSAFSDAVELGEVGEGDHYRGDDHGGVDDDLVLRKLYPADLGDGVDKAFAGEHDDIGLDLAEDAEADQYEAEQAEQPLLWVGGWAVGLDQEEVEIYHVTEEDADRELQELFLGEF